MNCPEHRRMCTLTVMGHVIFRIPCLRVSTGKHLLQILNVGNLDTPSYFKGEPLVQEAERKPENNSWYGCVQISCAKAGPR
jgi:hypothetical protein